MNERIRELAKQTDIIVVELLNDSQITMLEKFAELIVRECVDFLTDDLDYPDAALKLKARFGVENDT